MTDHERAFLTAIAAEPDADVHRLIYADWLDEQAGEATPRGEFIRVQVELAKMKCDRKGHHWPCRSRGPGGANGPFHTCETLRRREIELLSTEGSPILGTKWRRHPNGREETLAYRWAPVPVLNCDWWEFRRGFISTITLPCADFLQHAADIIEAVPMLEEVQLSDKRPWNSGNYRWGWSCSTGDGEYGGDFWVLPYGLFHRLPSEGCLLTPFSSTRRWYKTETDAKERLSAACLTFARDQLADRHKQQERDRIILFGNPQAHAPLGVINRPSKKRR